MNASQQPPVFYANGVSPGPPVSPVRQASPQLPVNLGSNNPFRNRALSPSASTFAQAQAQAGASRPDRPTSTNPFVDDSDSMSPQSAPTGASSVFSPIERQPDVTSNTRDLFENLTLNPTPAQPPQQLQPAPTGFRQPPPRPDGTPRAAPSTKRHPSSRERERERSARKPRDPLDIFADPPKSSSGRPRGERERRPRRNSESSVMDRSSKMLDTEDDQRRRERRRRERDARHRDGKSRSKKAHYHMDIIDKLDVTSIYGTGMFHHDGPFDACNPNRNRKGLRTAPMQAFPKDSTNMALGGAGPNKEKLDLNLFNGTMQEGYNDYSSTGASEHKTEGVNFDPKSRIEPVHGPSSMGLGTSTFLEGAPASKSAMQRRASENDQVPMANGGGLQRKKSLAQRIRGINRAPTVSGGRVVSPEASYMASGGASQSPSARNEKNPFFQDYDDAFEKKGARIHEESREIGRARSTSSPKQSTHALERRHTNERSVFEDSKSPPGGGFINRMKSLRKPRPERRITNE